MINSLTSQKNISNSEFSFDLISQLTLSGQHSSSKTKFIKYRRKIKLPCWLFTNSQRRQDVVNAIPTAPAQKRLVLFLTLNVSIKVSPKAFGDIDSKVVKPMQRKISYVNIS